MLGGPEAALHYRHFTLSTNVPLSIYLSIDLSNCSHCVTISNRYPSPRMLRGPEAALHYRHVNSLDQRPPIYLSIDRSI